jgi:hypothetical protein
MIHIGDVHDWVARHRTYAHRESAFERIRHRFRQAIAKRRAGASRSR